MSMSRIISVFLVFLLIHRSNQSIFSSLIRNNLNRYLKNPLFTKSFVRTSGWQSDPDDGTGLIPSAQPLLMGAQQQSHGLDEFLKTQNQFANEHMLAESPFGSTFRFPDNKMPRMNNEFMKLHHPSIAAQTPPVIDPISNSKIDPAPFSAVTPEDFSFGLKALFNETQLNVNLDGNKRGRANSKSLLVSPASNNAYSDPNRINNYKPPKQNLTGFYVSDGPLNYAESNEIHRYARPKKNKQKNDLRTTLEHRLRNSNKYNQEKALNLKLEYGFRPLSASKKDFIMSTNSIQMPNESDSDNSDTNDESTPAENLAEQANNLYQSLLFNRTMKSFDSRGNGNHLDELSSSDYKKYISYPMETESSDVHKLAFTGVESFRPDHNYVGFGYDHNYRMLDVISNYPNIKNFRSQGIECARQAGYCEYDSSYPIDYINSVITNCTSIIDDMYTEMPENTDDFSGYKSLFQVSTGSTIRPKNNTLCDAERKYIRPSVIKDVRNEYHLILQSSFYFQQLPVEICLNPGSSCNHIGRCNVRVRCTQKFRMHMLISVVEPNSDLDYQQQKPNCPKMRMYRLPSACVCEMSNE